MFHAEMQCTRGAQEVEAKDSNHLPETAGPSSHGPPLLQWSKQVLHHGSSSSSTLFLLSGKAQTDISSAQQPTNVFVL